MLINVYLNKVSDACWWSENNPLINRDGLLIFIFLDCDVSSKKQQREGRNLRAVVQENLSPDTKKSLTHTVKGVQQQTPVHLLTHAASLWHNVPNSYSVVWAESVPLVKREAEFWFHCLQWQWEQKCHLDLMVNLTNVLGCLCSSVLNEQLLDDWNVAFGAQILLDSQ